MGPGRKWGSAGEAGGASGLMVSGARPRVAAVEDGLKSWVPHWLPKVRPGSVRAGQVCARSSGAHTSPRQHWRVCGRKRCVAVLSTLRVLTAALSRVEEGDPETTST